MIAYVLCAVIVFQAVLHRSERRDLYSRIMSKSLAEYKRGGKAPPPSAHSEVLKRWRAKDGELQK